MLSHGIHPVIGTLLRIQTFDKTMAGVSAGSHLKLLAVLALLLAECKTPGLLQNAADAGFQVHLTSSKLQKPQQRP